MEGRVRRSVDASIVTGEKEILSEQLCCTYRKESGESIQIHRKSESVFYLCLSQREFADVMLPSLRNMTLMRKSIEVICAKSASVLQHGALCLYP